MWIAIVVAFIVANLLILAFFNGATRGDPEDESG